MPDNATKNDLEQLEKRMLNEFKKGNSEVVSEVSKKIDDSHEMLAQRLARIESNTEVLIQQVAEIKNYLFDFEDKTKEKLEQLKQKVERGFFRNNKKIEDIKARMKGVEQTVNLVKDYLEESNIEIRITASDFEGAIQDLGLTPKEETSEEATYEMHGDDSIVSPDHFIASNIFRMTRNDGEYLKSKTSKRLFEDLKHSEFIDVDKVAHSVRGMSQKEIRSINEARRISLNQVTQQTALRIRSEMTEEATRLGRPLNKKEIGESYQKVVDELKRDGWTDPQDPHSNNGPAERIAQNALISLNENREHFMKYHKAEFEKEADNIRRSLNDDSRKIRFGSEKGRFAGFADAILKQDQSSLECDPNSARSLFTAKNMAYLVRSAATNIVHSKSKSVFGLDVANELRDAARAMNTREGLMLSLRDYIRDNIGKPGAPPEYQIDEVDNSKGALKGQWDPKSWEARFIVGKALDIALAKKEPDNYRHLGAKDTTEKEKEIANMVISGACVLDNEKALDYVNGRSDDKRQTVCESYIAVMEQNGVMSNILKEITQHIPRQSHHQRSDLSMH